MKFEKLGTSEKNRDIRKFELVMQVRDFWIIAHVVL
jgi:hypothetical protein